MASAAPLLKRSNDLPVSPLEWGALLALGASLVSLGAAILSTSRRMAGVALLVGGLLLVVVGLLAVGAPARWAPGSEMSARFFGACVLVVGSGHTLRGAVLVARPQG